MCVLVSFNCTHVVHCLSISIHINIFEQKYVTVCLKNRNMFKLC